MASTVRSEGLLAFWSSIIGDKGMQDQLSAVMEMQDAEEKALTLLCRSLFLLIMEIKFERDEAQRKTGSIAEVMEGCETCRGKVMAEGLTDNTITDSSLHPGVLKDKGTKTSHERQIFKDKDAKTTLQKPQLFKDKHAKTNTISESRGGERGSHREATGEEAYPGGATGGIKLRNLPHKPFKTQSTTPPVKDGVDDAIPHSGNDILVPSTPGTMDIISSHSPDSQVDSAQEAFVTQKVYVPETVCMDDLKVQDMNDIFEDSYEDTASHTQTGTLVPATACWGGSKPSPVNLSENTKAMLRYKDNELSHVPSRKSSEKYKENEASRVRPPRSSNEKYKENEGSEACSSAKPMEKYKENEHSPCKATEKYKENKHPSSKPTKKYKENEDNHTQSTRPKREENYKGNKHSTESIDAEETLGVQEVRKRDVQRGEVTQRQEGSEVQMHGDMDGEEYTEDVLVASDSAFRSLHREESHLFMSPGREDSALASPGRDDRSFKSPKRKDNSFRSPARERESVFRSPRREKNSVFLSPRREDDKTLRSPGRERESTFRSPRRDKNRSFQSPRREREVTFGSTTDCTSSKLPSQVTKNTSPDKANTHNASPRKQHRSTSPSHSTPQKTAHKLATPEGSPVLGKGGRKRYPQSTTGDTKHKGVSAAAPQDSTPVRRLTLGDALVTPSGKEFKSISSFSPALNVSDDLTSPSLLQPLGGLCGDKVELPGFSSPSGGRRGLTGRATAGGGGGGGGKINPDREGGRGAPEEVGGGGGRGPEEGKTNLGGAGGKTDPRRGGGEGGGGKTNPRRETGGKTNPAGGKTDPGGGKGRKTLPRTASTSTSTPTRRLSLRRHHTVDGRQGDRADRAGGHGLGKLHVSPPDPNRKAGYRQTTVDDFLNSKKMGGSVKGGQIKRVFLDDEEAFRLAVKESLQLKALADMGRQLDQEEEEESVAGEEEKESVRVRGDKAIPSQQDILEPSPSLIRSQVPDESPVKLPNLRPAHTSPGPALTSPKAPSVTPRKVRHSVKRKIIQDKEEEKEVRKKEEEIVEGSKRRRKDMKKEEEEEEEEMVSFVSALEEVEEKVSPRKDGEKKTKRAPFYESFDILPQKKEEVKFAHQGEVVRKRAARKQLEGWSCKQCQEFYEKAGNTTQEAKEMMNKCSRHRSKYKPLSNTPEGFWNPFFDD